MITPVTLTLAAAQQGMASGLLNLASRFDTGAPSASAQQFLLFERGISYLRRLGCGAESGYLERARPHLPPPLLSELRGYHFDSEPSPPPPRLVSGGLSLDVDGLRVSFHRTSSKIPVTLKDRLPLYLGRDGAAAIPVYPDERIAVVFQRRAGGPKAVQLSFNGINAVSGLSGSQPLNDALQEYLVVTEREVVRGANARPLIANALLRADPFVPLPFRSHAHRTQGEFRFAIHDLTPERVLESERRAIEDLIRDMQDPAAWGSAALIEGAFRLSEERDWARPAADRILRDAVENGRRVPLRQAREKRIGQVPQKFPPDALGAAAWSRQASAFSVYPVDAVLFEEMTGHSHQPDFGGSYLGGPVPSFRRLENPPRSPFLDGYRLNVALPILAGGSGIIITDEDDDPTGS